MRKKGATGMKTHGSIVVVLYTGNYRSSLFRPVFANERRHCARKHVQRNQLFLLFLINSLNKILFEMSG
jgi:hypothetical protein